jgi:hypothetical protein
MKYLLSGLAAFLLLGAVMSTPAEARCWWNGWTTVCAPGYGYGYYRPYYRAYGWGYRHYYWRNGHRYYR